MKYWWYSEIDERNDDLNLRILAFHLFALYIVLAINFYYTKRQWHLQSRALVAPKLYIQPTVVSAHYLRNIANLVKVYQSVNHGWRRMTRPSINDYGRVCLYSKTRGIMLILSGSLEARIGTLSLDKQEKIEADAVKAEKKAEKKAELEQKKKEAAKVCS